MSSIRRLASRTRRTAGLAQGLLQANFSRLGHPLKLNFAVTYQCQYRCKTCNIWKRKPKDELSTQEILTFIRKNCFFRWADVTGGEIFLRPDIEEILSAILGQWGRLAVLHFPTNGFLTDRILDVTRKLAARSDATLVVTVSLDGDEQLNDEIRGIRGGFRRQIETFRGLRDIDNVHAVLGMTLSNHNLGSFESTFRTCSELCPGLEIHDFHLNLMQLSEHYYSNADLGNDTPPVDLALAELATYRQLRGFPRNPRHWVENTFLSQLEGFVRTGVTPMRCHALRSSCFIDSWGVVFPCISYSRPLGSLREHGMDLRSIWNSMQTRQTQREIWTFDCPQCWTACEANHTILGNLLRPDCPMTKGRNRTAKEGE